MVHCSFLAPLPRPQLDAGLSRRFPPVPLCVVHLGVSACLSAAAEPQASVHQMVRPVLIRNEHNSLVQLVIDTGETADVEVRSVVVTIVGALVCIVGLIRIQSA